MAESTSSGASTEPGRAEPEKRRFSRSRRLLLALGLAALAVGFGYWLLRVRPQALAVEAARSWQRDLPSALALARTLDRPLHVHFSSQVAPLARRMDETLTLEPVRRLAEAHFVSLRLDAQAESALFKRFIGSPGVLASCVVDLDRAGQLDVVAVAAGYVDPERYVAFLGDAAQTLPLLRELRDGSRDAARSLALGELYAAQGSVARARAAFAEITEPALRSVALEHLARLDVEAGFTAQARRELEEARGLAAEPGSPRLVLTEALLLSSERRVSEAVALLSAKLPPYGSGEQRWRSLLLLAQLEHELSRDADALAHLKQLQHDAPGSSWSRAAADRILHIEHPEPGHRH